MEKGVNSEIEVATWVLAQTHPRYNIPSDWLLDLVNATYKFLCVDISTNEASSNVQNPQWIFPAPRHRERDHLLACSTALEKQQQSLMDSILTREMMDLHRNPGC